MIQMLLTVFAAEHEILNQKIIVLCYILMVNIFGVIHNGKDENLLCSRVPSRN